MLSLISLPPLLNAILMIGTRILFALGRDGLLWPRLAAVNPRGTPGVATLATTAVAIVLIATGTFERLVALTASYLALNYAAACLALVVLRRREPSLPRPLRAWGYPWSAALVVAGALAFLVGVVIADARATVTALGLLAFGLVLHAVLPRRWRSVSRRQAAARNERAQSAGGREQSDYTRRHTAESDREKRCHRR